ncbi:MAG: hypothetical protein KAV87_19490 [Desulfobacteraceae bacterium]|nr:hypothetical protein [Desulfobacteraceae bacterium]
MKEGETYADESEPVKERPLQIGRIVHYVIDDMVGDIHDERPAIVVRPWSDDCDQENTDGQPEIESMEPEGHGIDESGRCRICRTDDMGGGRCMKCYGHLGSHRFETEEPEHPLCENCGHPIKEHGNKEGVRGCTVEGCSCPENWGAGDEKTAVVHTGQVAEMKQEAGLNPDEPILSDDIPQKFPDACADNINTDCKHADPKEWPCDHLDFNIGCPTGCSHFEEKPAQVYVCISCKQPVTVMALGGVPGKAVFCVNEDCYRRGLQTHLIDVLDEVPPLVPSGPFLVNKEKNDGKCPRHKKGKRCLKDVGHKGQHQYHPPSDRKKGEVRRGLH